MQNVTAALLEEALTAYEGIVRGFQATAEHFFSDLAVIGLTRDIFEQGHGTLLLVRSDVPRCVGVTGRACLEALLELILLVEAEDYDHAGSRIRAAELLDAEHNHRTADEACKRLGDPGPEPIDSARTVMEEEAAYLDGMIPGRGDIHRKAFEAVTCDRTGRPRKFHWSGSRNRSEAHKAAADHMGGPDGGMAGVVSSWYGLLCVEAHPAPRLTGTHISLQHDGRIRILVTPETEEELRTLTVAGLDAAYVSVVSAGLILTDVVKERSPCD